MPSSWCGRGSVPLDRHSDPSALRPGRRCVTGGTQANDLRSACAGTYRRGWRLRAPIRAPTSAGQRACAYVMRCLVGHERRHGVPTISISRRWHGRGRECAGETGRNGSGAAKSAAPGTDLLGAPRLAAALLKDFLNTSSSSPRAFADSRTLGDVIPIAYAGLMPGGVGVYQVNITLPQDLTSYPCVGDVHSNSVLNVTSLQGTESIALCIQQ